MKYLIPFILSLLIFLAACSHKATPQEYVHYIEKNGNGLLVKQNYNGVDYSLQYQPADYCVMMEKRSFNIEEETFAILKKRFSGLEHYLLRINRTDMDNLVNKLGDSSRYKKSIATYLDFDIQKDIKLLAGKDTIPCSICVPDANSGITQYYTYSLGFSKVIESASGEKEDRIILYKNKILNTGTVMLNVKYQDIEKIPALKNDM